MKALTSAFSVLVVLGLVVAGCGGGQDSSSTSPAADPEAPPAAANTAGDRVQLAIAEAVAQDGRLRFSGTTNLPDGALIAYVVEHDGFASGDFDGYLEGLVTIEGGAFSQELDVDGWPRGHAITRLSFSMSPGHGGDQPAAIVERYGPNGERLEGPDVAQFGDSRRLEVKTDIELP